MRKLLNTVYITSEKAFLSLDGENLVCKLEDKDKFRIPFDNVESIVCFSYLGCSPALMGKSVEKAIPINFVSPQGKFLAKICGETKGNVFLRIQQINCFSEKSLFLAQNTMATKFKNSRKVILRTLHDNPNLKDDEQIVKVLDFLKQGIEKVLVADSNEEILGIEGSCARSYFSVFNKLITNKKSNFEFVYRNKRPPLDPVNAVLSFCYTLFTMEYASALETVGLDSYIGFFHSLRSGRVSLACDLVEEVRCLVDRFTLTLINLQILNTDDFEKQISGAVLLNEEGRKKVITKWQEKKRTDVLHPYLKQKIPFGLIPYVQCNLLAKYIRNEIPEYSCYLI